MFDSFQLIKGCSDGLIGMIGCSNKVLKGIATA
jgi:hypothetical protein